MTRTVVTTLLLAPALAGCSAAIGPCTTTGTIQTQMTDTPFPFDSVQSVNVFVVRVDAYSPGGGWVAIATPNQSFDLLTLQNGTSTTLGEVQIAIGSYSDLRVLLDTARSNIRLKDGTKMTGSTTPGILWSNVAQSGFKVALAATVPVATLTTTTLRIDFNVEQSFVLRGSTISSGGLLFQPVVTATVIPSVENDPAALPSQAGPRDARLHLVQSVPCAAK